MKEIEHQHQCAVIRWFDLQYKDYRGRLYASPNGGKRNLMVAMKLKAEGVRPGVPDLMLPVPSNGYHGLYIEMKKPKGKATESQLDWIDFLNGQGYLALVCCGFDEAKAAIEKYLQNSVDSR